MKTIKNIIYVIVAILFAIVFFTDDEELEPKELIGTSGDPNQTWSIYWYLCGSDLESEAGFASDDLDELLSVQLPEIVKVVIQTGGANDWYNEEIKSSKTQRFLYSSKGLELIEEKPSANMGDPRTLTSFLKFATEKYPADKKAVIFWNHGGGSVSGASFDELHDYDSLTLEEFYKGFKAAVPVSKDNPPFEVIGFDTCLMATVDTAYTFADIGKYLVASEENEPGGGWDYAGFMGKLAEDPGMDGARLGQHICDTYMDDCGWFSEDDATLSVIDLRKSHPLYDAYEEMGAEALRNALDDPYFFCDFSASAEVSENYGGNTRDQGYTNMVDLGSLAENCKEILPNTADKVINTLKDCVIYQVKGMFREEGHGLSCYYSYNGDEEDFVNYLDQGCSDSFKYLFGYGFIGEVPQEGMEYIHELGYRGAKLPHVPTLLEDGDKEYPVTIDKDGYVGLKLDKKIADLLKTVVLDFAYVDEKNDMIVMLGEDNDMDGDMEKGEFKDNFRGVWGSIDGHLVYTEIDFETEDFTIYSVPILLNGEECNLRVSYDYKKEKYEILGARKAIDENGMADRNIRVLKPGDKITPIHYGMKLSGDENDDELIEIKKEEFTVTKKTKFKEKDLPDGEYIMMYELLDAKNNSAYSQMVNIDIKGEDMDVSVLE